MESPQSNSLEESTLKKQEVESFPLRITGDLQRILKKPEGEHVHLVGSHSVLGLSLLVSQSKIGFKWSSPQVVITQDEASMEQVVEDLLYFNPTANIHILPEFDVSPYSNLYPNPRKMSLRLNWLFKAQQATNNDIFVASAAAVLQKTIPFKELRDASFTIIRDEEIPDGLPRELEALGYLSVPVVEDVGTYSLRGGIVDIFSPAHESPLRIELFGDLAESIRLFDPESQRSLGSLEQAFIIPPREVLYNEENRQFIVNQFRTDAQDRGVDPEEVRQTVQAIIQKQYFHGVDFLLPYFYEKLDQPLDHFSTPVHLWMLEPLEVAREFDNIKAEYKKQYSTSQDLPICIKPGSYFDAYEDLRIPHGSKTLSMESIDIQDEPGHTKDSVLSYRAASLAEFQAQCQEYYKDTEKLTAYIQKKIREWIANGYQIYVSTHTENQAQRVQLLLEKSGFTPQHVKESNFHWEQLKMAHTKNSSIIPVIPRGLSESLRLLDEGLIFLRDEDFFGKKSRRREFKKTGSLGSRAHALAFGDLNPGDLIIHKLHGMGVYQGLKVMPIQGVDAEFIQLEYKGGDKLYLPVYRVGQIQKYSGGGSGKLVDKLGGSQWNKVKTRVKKQIRDIASELLKLYAKRAQSKRPPFTKPEDDFIAFENHFAFEETEDQLKAINEVLIDMTSDKPMDRLVCGDVGFGKTEVAMRAAFKAVQDGKQVSIIAPTTILSFQHAENFRKRFKDWPVSVRSLNRFITSKEVKNTLQGLKTGQVDIVIGTHRLFSKDVEFKDLGLLIIDEEQKFGVKHKEKIRQMKVSVDTLAMSATPIPRTLNLSLIGLRDLSLITTPPVDRLPTRTFVCKFDKETVRKAIESEIRRGGQIFFLHNRVNSIYAVASELREIVPTAKIKVGHGQMEEKELEQTMLQFFNHEIDVLVCTTIIESGMDIPRANTMFIDNAHSLGLSQLYQLRGRVGRSKERAYCYLMVPPNRKVDNTALERLKVIQENTALGSGITIAQHDLELRGSGDILGQEQSGHINAIGYEMYLELLEDAIAEVKGEPTKSDIIEPEINIRIPALIPDKYIPDIRIRLSYYKALAEIESPGDLDRIEEELQDQFGKPPESVLNLMGLMLIRKYCRDLGIKDVSSSINMITLSFTDKTPLPSNKAVELSVRENKKYAITPDYRLKIRMKTITWPNIYDELMYLLRMCPSSNTMVNTNSIK